MYNWYKLGQKIGQLDIMLQISDSPSGLVSPHDIENEYYLIVELLQNLFEKNIDFEKIDIRKFYLAILNLINEHLPNELKKNVMHLFTLGFYTNKVRIIFSENLDEFINERVENLFEELKYLAKDTKIWRIVSNISLEKRTVDIFEKIDSLVMNDCSDLCESENQISTKTIKWCEKITWNIIVPIIVGIIIAIICAWLKLN